MITVKRPHKADTVAQALKAAALDAHNRSGHSWEAKDVPGAYRDWANAQVRMLTGLMSSGELDRVLTTRQYWLIQTIDAEAYGIASFAQFVRQEFQDRWEFLEAEAKVLEDEWARWNQSSVPHVNLPDPTHAVALDTNVFLHHWDELERIDWNNLLGIPATATVSIALIPQVLRELDAQKLNHKKMKHQGVEVEVSSMARHPIRIKFRSPGKARFGGGVVGGVPRDGRRFAGRAGWRAGGRLGP